MNINKSNIDNVFKSKTSSIETMELKGYKHIKTLFCDSSGLGYESEPALTKEQLIKELSNLLDIYNKLTVKILDIGQFQVYLGIFKKSGRPIAKIIGNNTLEYIKDDKRIIRLYDTNIITFDNNKIILNTGGFNTVTTKARINKFLNNGYVYQKNFEMYCNYKEKTYKFENDTLILNQ